MNVFGKIIREPLLHFLLIGGGLFLLFNMMNVETVEKPNRIVVTQGQVALMADKFTQTWERPPSNEEIDSLIDNYLLDEVYYREALALGLDEDDSVIRRRLRQKMGFILEDITTLLDPDEKELTTYMDTHAEQFRVQPQVSFRQVYLSRDTRTDIDADAREILTRLRAGEDPQQQGDRIMLADAYTLTSRDDIKRRFGESFAHQLLTVEPGEWTGPLNSGFGGHLVLITEIKPGRIPDLAEVKEEVKGEWLLARKEELKQNTFRMLLKNYEVVMPDPVETSDVVSSTLSPIDNAVAAWRPGKEAR
ncbi:MAG: peptidylprolyl isomerase [Desulfuromonadales bacterium]|nr:peptidylprolyl isomerase [Desulfuromonadales bacterium]